MGPARIALAAMLVNLLSGGVALAFLAGEKGLAVLLSLPLAALLGLGLHSLGYMRFLQRGWMDDRRPHFAIAAHFAALQTAKLKLAVSREEALALLEQICLEFGARECRVSLKDASNDSVPWTWHWTDPDSSLTQASVLDRIRLAATRNHASWSLDNDDREPELNMNLRVLMVEFMHPLLERLVELAPGNAKILEHRKSAPLVNLNLVLSVKGFKRRL